jgi:hypothetical protein
MSKDTTKNIILSSRERKCNCAIAASKKGFYQNPKKKIASYKFNKISTLVPSALP